jgi:predicted transcriptional regulator
MEKRKLTITLQSDWKAALRAAGQAAQRDSYQGETLNFESTGAFFSRLTARRWMMVNVLQGVAVPIGVRELARRVGRDVKRVHEDSRILIDLGLIERSETGALYCPYSDIHVDMHMAPEKLAA